MTRRIETINYSEFAALADCETKWGYAYLLQREEDRSDATGLHKGTLIHLGLDRWTLGLGATLPEWWEDDINTGGKPGEIRRLHLTDFDPLLVQQVEWLLARYVQVYGSAPPSSWNVIATEQWLTGRFKIGSRTVRIVGRHDGFIEVAGLRYLIERKSYGQRGRLNTIGVEPQPTMYYDLIEQNYGVRPDGIMYDGIYTHQFVPKVPTQKQLIEEHEAKVGEGSWASVKERTEWARAAVAAHPGVERDPADSFEREWIDRTPAALEMGHTFLGAAIKRRDKIRTLDDTIPHVGRHCDWCGFKSECWFRLSGVQDEIVLSDAWNNGDEPV